jgi:hypothetical protein
MSSTSSAYTGLALAAAIIPVLLGLVFNAIIGAIAVGMAKKRGLKPVPAFFAGLFGSFLALFFIAMFPNNGGYSNNQF